MFEMSTWKTIAAAAVFAVAGSAASAATVQNCSERTPDVSGLVVPNIGCQLLLSSDNDNVADVQGMFGVSDWQLWGKLNSLPGSVNGFAITGDGEDGEWSIAASILNGWENIMMTFKGGDKALPETVVGYLIRSADGSYYSPFFKEHRGGYKFQDISHISLFVATPAAVPLPAAGFLLIGALGGLAALRRRKTA